MTFIFYKSSLHIFHIKLFNYNIFKLTATIIILINSILINYLFNYLIIYLFYLIILFNYFIQLFYLIILFNYLI